MASEQRGIEVGPHGVDVVEEEPLQLRPFGEQPREHAGAAGRVAPQHVRDLIPVAHRVQALLRQVVGVVGALARLLGPADECRMQAVADLLLLLVEQLMRKLFPGKPQVAGHRDHPQADRSAR